MVGDGTGVGVPVSGMNASITAWRRVAVKSGVGFTVLRGAVTRKITKIEATNNTTATAQYKMDNVFFRNSSFSLGSLNLFGS